MVTKESKANPTVNTTFHLDIDWLGDLLDSNSNTVLKQEENIEIKRVNLKCKPAKCN